MKIWNQQRKRRVFAWLFCMIGIGVVPLGVLLGTTLLHSQPEETHAAGVQKVFASKMTPPALAASLLPMRLMYGMSAKMSVQGNDPNAAQAGMSCLKSQVKPLCYSLSRSSKRTV